MLEAAIRKIILHLEESWYLELLVILAASFSLFLTKRSGSNFRVRTVYRLYLITVLFLFIGGNIILSINFATRQLGNIILEFGNTAFNMIEAYVFLTMLSWFINSNKARIIINGLLYCNILLTLVGFLLPAFLSSYSEIYRWNTFFTVIHYYTIIIPCIWYFHDLYKNNKPLLSHEIVVIVALMLYSLTSIPFFALLDFSYANTVSDFLYAMHYLFLSGVCLAFSLSERMRLNIKREAETMTTDTAAKSLLH